MKEFHFISHVADVRMKIQADSLIELFEAAVLGMDDILQHGFCKNNQGNIVREISITALNATTLIIDFLSEILTCSYEEKAIFCKIDFLKINETLLEAKIYGKRVKQFKEEIKAVTYHEAKVKKNEKGKLETIIIFDI